MFLFWRVGWGSLLRFRLTALSLCIALVSHSVSLAALSPLTGTSIIASGQWLLYALKNQLYNNNWQSFKTWK